MSEHVPPWLLTAATQQDDASKYDDTPALMLLEHDPSTIKHPLWQLIIQSMMDNKTDGTKKGSTISIEWYSKDVTDLTDSKQIPFLSNVLQKSGSHTIELEMCLVNLQAIDAYRNNM